jgi:hypothetical protein
MLKTMTERKYGSTSDIASLPGDVAYAVTLESRKQCTIASIAVIPYCHSCEKRPLVPTMSMNSGIALAHLTAQSHTAELFLRLSSILSLSMQHLGGSSCFLMKKRK